MRPDSRPRPALTARRTARRAGRRRVPRDECEKQRECDACVSRGRAADEAPSHAGYEGEGGEAEEGEEVCYLVVVSSRK